MRCFCLEEKPDTFRKLYIQILELHDSYRFHGESKFCSQFEAIEIGILN
jgi:hypothetical protein